jgi:ribonuclease VapC
VIVDASALLAVLFVEVDKDLFRDRLLVARGALMSPVNYLEAAVRADDPRHPNKGSELENLMDELAIELANIDGRQARIAREAYQRYGKGNHEARLNLGDCFAYALAKARAEPLLFKGDDFRQTDVEAAL